MKLQEVDDKLKNAYKEMVDNIESLMQTEGKALKEAVEIAEDKLLTLKELSKEEVRKVSDEVKGDLKSIGETLQGAKEAYKEQLKFDAAYLTETIWEKLSKAADVGTEEFIAFTEDLKEKVREVRRDEHANEHSEHVSWSSDHGFWMDEIEIWKKDHQRALEHLQAIEAAIKKHSNELEEHAQVIQAHEAREKEHEEVMAGEEQDPTSRVLEEEGASLDALHEQERLEHQKHAELHDKFKNGHRKIMSLINHLYKEVVND